MKNRTSNWKRIAMGTVLATTGAVYALPPPAAPTAAVRGEPGTSSAAYWVAAENADGKLTTLSPPAILNNLPEALDADNHVELTLQPVDGAVRYHVIKTTELAAPSGVTVAVGQSGDQTFYYWLQARNGWRRSALAGPFAAKDCATAKGNLLEWQAVANATAYDIFRTDRPQPPRGFVLSIIGLSVPATQWRDTGIISTTTAGYGANAAAEPPFGRGLFLLATTNVEQLTVRDQGQSLGVFIVPTVNATERTAVTTPTEPEVDMRAAGRPGYVQLHHRQTQHCQSPTFGTGAVTLRLDQTIESGGHSDYPAVPPGIGGKAMHAVGEFHQTSHVATQAVLLGGYQRSYGTGDMIWFGPHMTYYGSNNDGGDEGVYPIRQSLTRALNGYETLVSVNAVPGATTLEVEHLNDNRFGAERLVVNLTQAHSAGRITRVDNVTVHGRDTQWDAEMEGCWISFDVDNVVRAEEGRNNEHRSTPVGTYRMWYLITKVHSATELTILARTGWSGACNMGYSRWIYDPSTSKLSNPPPTNQLALRSLPEERAEAASQGRYMICPGTMLGDPWRPAKNRLNVAPLDRNWSQGDQIAIVGGPQAWIGGGRIMLWGDYLPQDVVKGLSIVNNGSRPANAAGIEISNAASAGFADGINITLANDGHGNGLVISAATGWDAKGFPAGSSGVHQGAIVLPDNLPAIVGQHNSRYPHIRWAYSDDGQSDALQIAAPETNKPVASFDRHGTTTIKKLVVQNDATVGGDLAIAGVVHGSSQTRGKAVFSGNGEQTRFSIAFPKATTTEPFVSISTDQFTPSRLAEVKSTGITVEFQSPPPVGQDNIQIWWMAQQ